jgi:hypothetical protein
MRRPPRGGGVAVRSGDRVAEYPHDMSEAPGAERQGLLRAARADDDLATVKRQLC